MLDDSTLLAKLNNHSYNPYGQPLCIIGYPTYPVRVRLQGSLQNNASGLTPNQQTYNKSMSQGRCSVK